MDLRNAIITADDLKREQVEVPEWGVTVYVRTMTGAEKDLYEEETYKFNGDDVEINRRNLRARLVVKTLCDENGKRLFNDGEQDLIASKSGAAIDRIFEVASKLNALTKADEEQLVKN